MKLSELFVKEAMDLQLSTTDKPSTLKYLAERFHQAGGVSDVEAYVAALEAREAQSTTGVGDEIAIPHAQHESIKSAAIVFGRSEAGIDWESFDGQAAKYVFMIAAPAGGGGEHLQALAKLSSVLMQPETKAAQATVAEPTSPAQEDVYVLAVTACPTGIAHTFMAEEKLKQAGKAAGIKIKVETNGQAGVGNRLTADDIKKATAIIVAADKQVEMARFNGKPVIVTKVADGIHKADELVAKAAKAEAPIYHAAEGAGAADLEVGKESIGRQFYKHLMNGVSHMLPFVVSGGILIALSFFWGINSFNPEDASYHQIAQFLFVTGKLAFAMMLPMLAGFIGHSIADRPGLVVGFMGGILANPSVLSDFGAVGLFEKSIPSGFLGALVAGFLAGGIIYVLRLAFAWLPKSLEGLKPIFLFPVFGVLIMSFLMLFVVNGPMGAVMQGLQDFLNGMSTGSALVLGFLVGAMMSIDMGGPINKAAYVTGTALVTQSAGAGSNVMAAVMVGGMVPPLAIALAATLNKNLWPEEERNSALVNYVMGAAFITEGAIPFAAANPLKVIPPLAVSAGVAGALSMLFGIVSKVPHGGVFAMLAGGVTNPLLYLAIWVGASFLGAFLLSLTLRNNNKK